MLGIALVLIVGGLVLIPSPRSAGSGPPNLFALMLPFILIFVGIILAFIAFIIYLATVLNYRVSGNLFRIIERLLIGGIVLGVIGMIQPWILAFFQWGFLLLLVCTLSYIVWSHIVPRGATQLLEAGTVSVTELEKHEAIG